MPTFIDLGHPVAYLVPYVMNPGCSHALTLHLVMTDDYIRLQNPEVHNFEVSHEISTANMQ